MKVFLPVFLVLFFGVGLYIVTKKPETNVAQNSATSYDFDLKTADGNIALDKFKGKSIIMYFGYMLCPDICPTTLNDISQSFEHLSEEEIKNTQVIFVSVDPSRDTLSDLKAYTEYFYPSFIGATNDEPIIKELTQRYQAYYKYEKQENSILKYTVAHTTRIYLLNNKGNLVSTLSTHNIDTQQIANAIKHALNN